MIIYVICYGLVGALLFNIEKSKYPPKIYIFICILLLSLLAGFRDINIGADIRTYANGVSIQADKVTNLSELFNFIFYSNIHLDSGVESGYLLIAFIGTKIFGGLFGTLFLTSLVINACFIIGLYRIREHIPFNICVMIYCFMHYQSTYNAMRQWMAMAIIVFGIKYIYDKKLIKYLSIVAVAMLFHTTAFIGISLYFIAGYLNDLHIRKRQIIVIIAALFAIILYREIVNFLVTYGIISSKYLHYAVGDRVTFFWQEFLVRLPPVLLGLVFYRPMEMQDKYHNFWFTIMIIELILSQLHSVTDYATRISSYFYVGHIYEMALACKIGSRENRTLVKLLVAAYIILYWFVMYIYFGYGATYPYSSQLLGIQ